MSALSALSARPVRSVLSAFSVLDATRLCTGSATAAEGWSRPVPTRPRPQLAALPFSWAAFARNPSALVVSAVVGTMLAGDAVSRALSARAGGPR